MQTNIDQKEMKHIIFVSQKDSWTNGLAFGLAKYLKKMEFEVEICDLSFFDKAYPYWIRVRFQEVIISRLKNNPKVLLKKLCHLNSIKYYILGSQKDTDDRKLQLESEEFLNRLLRKPESIQKWTEFQGRLGPSLYSSLVTKIALDEVVNPFPYKQEIKSEIQTFLKIRNRLEKSGILEPGVIGYVFNGRLPLTASVISVLEDRGLEFNFYEYAPPSYRIYLEKFRSQSRVLTQRNVFNVLRDLSRDEIISEAKAYISERQNNSTFNQFVTNTPIGNYRLRRNLNKRLAVIFTSSPDEIVGISDELDKSDLGSQAASIAKAVKRLEELNFEVIIRVHPNMINKSWRMYLRETLILSKLTRTVILPLDQVNSYELIKMATIVITCGSTIGLEAVAMSKPTYLIGSSFYDLLTDIRKLESNQDIEKCDFEPYTVEEKYTHHAIVALKRANARLGDSIEFQEFMELCKTFENQSTKLKGLLKVVFGVPSIIQLIGHNPRNLANILKKLVGKKNTSRIFRVFTVVLGKLYFHQD